MCCATASGAIVSIVDVPGHEGFVRTMVAGAGGIDLVLLVVSAEDGVMPQTREHIHVCSLLGVKCGVVALTKIDRAEEEWIALVEDEVRELVRGTFLADAPIMKTSVVTNDGIRANLDIVGNARFIRENVHFHNKYIYTPTKQKLKIK